MNFLEQSIEHFWNYDKLKLLFDFTAIKIKVKTIWWLDTTEEGTRKNWK